MIIWLKLELVEEFKITVRSKKHFNRTFFGVFRHHYLQLFQHIWMLMGNTENKRLVSSKSLLQYFKLLKSILVSSCKLWSRELV